MSHAIVVFRHSGLQNALTDSHRRWMSRGDVQVCRTAIEPLNQALSILGLVDENGALASLRYLGQTGQRVDNWIAAADPISFEPRLRDIVAHRISPHHLPESDFAALLDSAQDVLAEDGRMRFERVGRYGYLTSTEAMQTPGVSATTMHGYGPDEYLPTGDVGRQFHRIHSELQMLFHDHIVNQQRAGQSLPVVNGLWLWGGGRLRETAAQNLPVLFGDDPLFAGYWSRHGAMYKPWPGSVSECVTATDDSVIITVPESSTGVFDNAAQAIIDEIGALIKRRRITKLNMIFNNEVTVRLRWSELAKFWRRGSALYSEPAQYD